MTLRNRSALSKCVPATAMALLCCSLSLAQTSGSYALHTDQPKQVIKGLGFEIQSDSIGSGNAGMPDAIASVPHDLTPAEKQRFYTQMLHGFRYTRLAMGLYLRGLDPDKKHIVERFPGQMDDLRDMQNVAGIEGFDVEYWSPAPAWKDTQSYYGGTIAASGPAFLNAYSDALAQDVKYLQAHGLHVVQWGLQNEPVFGKPKKDAKPHTTTDANQSYATAYYSPEDYAAVLKSTIPKLRAINPALQIHANSWEGPTGPFADEIRKDPALLKQIDAWTWHMVGSNSNAQIERQAKLMQGAMGKPVYQNEFEYQPWDKQWTTDDYFMNTGQALMNWMVFEDSPIWYWIHALKPVTNVEATGYALGFWRPYGDLKQNLRPGLEAGHWEFNAKNWNAVAGFLKYLGWDSIRLAVSEDVVQHDQRLMAWRTKAGKLSIALSNRGNDPYTFHLHGIPAGALTGHRYTVNALDTPVGTREASEDFAVTVQPQSYEFWIANQASSATTSRKKTAK